jgi:hypothetical protein
LCVCIIIWFFFLLPFIYILGYYSQQNATPPSFLFASKCVCWYTHTTIGRPGKPTTIFEIIFSFISYPTRHFRWEFLTDQGLNVFLSWKL